MASSFDQIGPMTKTVEDAEIIFNAIKGRDIMDSTSVDFGNIQNKNQGGKKLRIGLLKYDKSGVDKEINESMEKSVEIFKDLGYEISEIELPNINIPCLAIIYSRRPKFLPIWPDLTGSEYGLFKEGKNLTEDYMKTREAGFGLETRRRIMLGTYVLSAGYYDAYYTKAQKVEGAYKKRF